MDHQLITIPLRNPVKSLCWLGDALIDWAGGNRVIDVPGGERERSVGLNWTYRFDAAVQSPSGRYAAIYERFGTKGLLLERGKLLREINRSYYCADDYEYPITFVMHPDGRALLAHCPEEYNQIEIDDVATGQRLTASANREPEDVFHSRLAVGPDHRRLLSAGWIWHPINTVSIWSVSESLADGRVLDVAGPPALTQCAEVDDAVFIDADRLLLSSNPGAQQFGSPSMPFHTGSVGVFDARASVFERVVKIDEPVGRMLWLGDDRVVGFHGNPKLFDLRTGKVLLRWPDLATGELCGSISGRLDNYPVLAIDSARRRFAVASGDTITVVQFPGHEE